MKKAIAVRSEAEQQRYNEAKEKVRQEHSKHEKDFNESDWQAVDKIFRGMTKSEASAEYHPAVQGMMNEWDKTTGGYLRGLGNHHHSEKGDAFAELVPQKHGSKPTVHLDWLSSAEKGSGAGSETLKHITNLADKHGVHLTLSVGVGPVRGGGSPKPRLRTFYSRHGFTPKGSNPDYMHREPAQKDDPTIKSVQEKLAQLQKMMMIGHGAMGAPGSLAGGGALVAESFGGKPKRFTKAGPKSGQSYAQKKGEDLDKVASPKKGHTIAQLERLKESGYHNPDTGTELEPDEADAHLNKLRQNKADKQTKAKLRSINGGKSEPKPDSPDDWAGIIKSMNKIKVVSDNLKKAAGDIHWTVTREGAKHAYGSFHNGTLHLLAIDSKEGKHKVVHHKVDPETHAHIDTKDVSPNFPTRQQAERSMDEYAGHKTQKSESAGPQTPVEVQKVKDEAAKMWKLINKYHPDKPKKVKKPSNGS